MPLDRNAPRWTDLRTAGATLLVAAGMSAGVVHCARGVDAARAAQIRVGDLRAKAAHAAYGLEKAGRDAAEKAARAAFAGENRATIAALDADADLLLAAVDRRAAAEARSADARLERDLAAFADRLEARAEDARSGAGVSLFASLLLSAALVAGFAARHRLRSEELAALERGSQSTEARERRFRLLLEIEEATGDLADPDRVRRDVLGRLAAFFGAPAAAKETLDPAGRTVGEPLGVGAAAALPRLGPQDLASLRAGRTKLHDGLLRCPLMRGGELRAVVTLRAAPGAAWHPEAVALVEEAVARLWAYHERTEAEAAKRQSRWSMALLDAQVNSSLDGILVVDHEGRKVLQNRRMAEVWGIPDDVAQDPDDARQVRWVTEATRNPETFASTVQAIYADPTRVQRDEIELRNGVVLDRHTGPALGADGTVYGRIWTFRDITDRIRAEQALREAHDGLEAHVEERTRDLAAATHEAERANAAKSEFLSRMSHELRTPLNAILGFGQILDRQALDALQKESVHYILKGGRHLLGLINEVLDLSRVETGHAELSIEPVPLADVLVESLAMVRPMAADREVALITVGGDDESLHVVADRQRLKQVLINLLSNAVKYNRSGGRVVARASVVDGRLRLAVEDTGRGISPEGIAKLFAPFERLEASATSIEGTGLGLFLTQKLVVTMGGRVTVESVEGEGSTFTVDLELARSPAEALALVPGGLSDPEPREDRAFTILSIEDNSANVRLLERLFESRPDVRLLCAERGMEGFELARRAEPDLVLLDLNLPDVSGTEVLARLKRSATTRAIPVIIVSADAADDKVRLNLEAGAHAFLPKPVDVDRLLRTMDDALGVERRRAA